MSRNLMIGSLLLSLLLPSLLPAPSSAARPDFGQLYYNDTIVRTVVPPAANPQAGRDNFYKIPNQMAVVGVAPGDQDYHGGQWAFHQVTWNTEAYLLTSEAAVLAAELAEDITIARQPDNDFKCPVQP